MVSGEEEFLSIIDIWRQFLVLSQEYVAVVVLFDRLSPTLVFWAEFSTFRCGSDSFSKS